MLIDRQCEENVIHLIYPLRKRSNNNSLKNEDNPFEELDHWERLFKFNNTESSKDPQHSYWQRLNPINEQEFTTHLKYYYSSESSLLLKNMISENQVAQYFHPSLHNILFPEGIRDKQEIKKEHYKDKAMKAYRIIRDPQSFVASWDFKDNDIKPFHFEWLSSEVYMFHNVHFLVIRLTLLTDEEKKTVQDWTSFVNGIRMSYPKYESQKVMYVNEDNKEIFYDQIKDLMSKDQGLKNLAIASREVFEISDERTVSKEKYKLPFEEPMAFVHGFVTSVSNFQSLDEKEIYQVMNLDEFPHEPYIDTFEKESINQSLFARWKNQGTYYTAVDYAAMTVHSFSHDRAPNPYLYQHHCTMYLILVLLQLNYREELQSILHRFSQLRLEEDCDYQAAKGLLQSYYDLNQYFIFERLTNEIQGVEMWRFYERCLGTRSLYEAVEHDMRELNQRLIQYQNEKQTASNTQQENKIYTLTIVSGFAGILGMNRLIDENEINGFWVFLDNDIYISFIRAIAATLILGLVFIYLSKSNKEDGSVQDKTKNKGKVRRWPIVIIFFIIFFLDLVLSRTVNF